MSIRQLITVFSIFTLVACQAHYSGKPRYRVDPESEEDEVEATFIVINVPARELSLFNKGKPLFRFPVAVGSPVYKTPVGDRFLREIVWNPWWLPPDSPWAADASPTPPGPNNPLGAVKMDLGGAILLHGTNKEYTVGTPASHGCMRMFNADAKTLAWWIQSHFTEKREEILLEEYAAHRGRSYHTFLEQPIPVEIVYEVFGLEDALFRLHPDIYGRMGDRKKSLYSFFEGMGYSADHLDETAVTRILDQSKNRRVEIPLRDLIPGKWLASRQKMTDPLDETWKYKRLKVSKKDSGTLGKLAFLFSKRFL